MKPVLSLQRTGFFRPEASNVGMAILITGGARSGKSRFAEAKALEFRSPLCYVATGSAGDAEMAERIARHRARRGKEWETVEEPLRLPEVLREHDGRYGCFLVDCLTLWISNLLFHHGEDRVSVLEEVRLLAETLPALATPVILVTNEVGMGIVPENRLARLFRDLAGEANEIVATAADEVYVCFSGLPLRLK
jgi:adenosylcobinamide kinase / adenosylcobinamide-phosphate guanylyltransferase